jgi:translation initiation factor IF-2
MALISRSPIVCILGHVDHGKTTLLDTIRKTNVASKEAGGITQSIGASQITLKDGKKITFIDTPGHAAFSKMRSRGAKVADIVILVVAAEDGIKPQTKEAIDIIKEAKLPLIVAITKIDLPSANVDGVRSQLENEEIFFEGRGGETPLIPVSARKGEGIQELLDTIILLAEVTDIKSDPEGALEAVIIETQKDKRGSLVSVVVRNGSLKVGNTVYAEDMEIKIKGLFNDAGKSVKEILPGEPVQILGFEVLPPVGAIIKSTKELKTSKDVKKDSINYRLGKDDYPIILKAKNQGSLEAIIAGLPSKIVVVETGVGEINESDVLLAKSSGVPKIFSFESKVSPQVLRLSETEGVKIEQFSIIYELFQRLEEILKGETVEIKGTAEIVAIFPFDGKKIAGCKALTGKIAKANKVIIKRGDKELGKVKIISMKKGKNEVAEVGQGEEFGILTDPQLDFASGDMVVSVAK